MAILRSMVGKVFEQPTLNYWVTNRVPRRQLTQFMAWFSRIRHPWIRGPSIALWKFFADVDLSDARRSRFASLHDCFTRELKDGARPLDPRDHVLVAPSDALVGATGTVTEGCVLQAKGQPYRLAELLCEPGLARRYEDGQYVTLRLTAGMYHRFHAPEALSVQQVTFVPGDTWNVNSPALGRIERLYCRNARAVVQCRTATGGDLVLVPVGAILVASIRLHCLGESLNFRYSGPPVRRCHADYQRGEEMGWFEHGSTIIMLVPRGWRLDPAVHEGAGLRMGQALFHRTEPEPA